MFNVGNKVTLSKESLYARGVFQLEGRGHLKVDSFGTITKVLKDMDEGKYVVKFKDNNVEKTNIYFEGMLILYKK